jgi:hypothetical protein
MLRESMREPRVVGGRAMVDSDETMM